jgi:hypothetical protein
MVPNDKNFICATWLNSYFTSSRFAKRITHRIFKDYHSEVIERILTNPKTEVLIASSIDDPDTIFGYLVFQKYKTPILHYVYVKHAFKKMGIAAELIQKADVGFPNIIVTHWTFDLEDVLDKYPTHPEMWESRYPEISYIPYLVS